MDDLGSTTQGWLQNIVSWAHTHPFYEMALILALTTLVGAIGYRLKQPLIIAFLAVGVLVGPAALGLIDDYERIELLAEIGIALLLFIVGMRLDLHLIRTMGPVALATGLGQVTFTAVIGYVIALALGFDHIPAAFIAVALTFSSTIIIVKLLSDKREIDALHGRIAVGMLIVQDIMAIIAMVGLIAISGGADADGGGPSIALQALAIFGKGILFLAAIVVMMRWVLPSLLERLSHYQELMVLFAIAWAISLAAIGDAMGFSKEVGAFLGGVALASTGYREAIGARLTTLRDFLLLFFFIALGAQMEFAAIVTQIPAALILSAFVLIGNPLIVMAIMGFMGYRRRTSLLTGLTVAQISEFSLILAALGMSLGHINSEAMSLITVVGVVTICASTYMILYSSQLYTVLGPFLTIFERRSPYREIQGSDTPDEQADTVIIGLGNYGTNLASNLLERGHRLTGIDFDPEVLRRWRDRMGVVYGDASDPEFLDGLEIGAARWIVSTTRDRDVNLNLLDVLRRRGFQARVALTARNQHDAEVYSRAGADVVLRPFRDAAEQGVDALHAAMHMLPLEIDWPLSLREVRIRPGSAYAGSSIRDLDLYHRTGVSVLAISRGGTVTMVITPDFTIYPGDRMVLMGPPTNLHQAHELLERLEIDIAQEEPAQFAVAEVPLAADSAIVGSTIITAGLREHYQVTLVGIRRGDEKILSPDPHETLLADDHLIVVGAHQSVERLRNDCSSAEA